MDTARPPAFPTRIFYLAAVLYAISLFVKLGEQPVYLEEPRRALIAMEMEEAGNWLVPRQLGAFYYRKPPVFNWMVMLSAKATGGYGRWALRLPTVFSLLATLLLLYSIGKRYEGPQFGRVWAALYAGSGAILFYFSLLGEIDLFYSFVTLGSMLAFFHFYQQQHYAQMFGWSYALAAVGLLTKGLPAIPFLGLTVLAWLVYEKRLKLLLAWQHLVGIGVFVAIAGGYLLAYHQYNSLDNYLADWLTESVGRTAVGNELGRTIGHLATFPLDTLKDMLPGSLLLLLFATRRDIWAKARQHPLVAFGLVVFAANFLVYWFSPGARQRYIYMLYPLLYSVGVLGWQYRGEAPAWREGVFGHIVLGLMVALCLGSLGLNAVPAFDFLEGRLLISLLGALAFGGLAFLVYQDRSRSLWALFFGLIAARLLFAFTVLPQRSQDSAGQRNTDIATAIYEIVGDEPLCLYEGGRVSYTVIYELDRRRERTVVFCDTLVPGAFIMVPADSFPAYHGLVDIPFHDGDFKLIEVPR